MIKWNKFFFIENTNLKYLPYEITQGFEITQANFQKITQATGGFFHSQPPDMRTKKSLSRKTGVYCLLLLKTSEVMDHFDLIAAAGGPCQKRE